MYYYIRKISVGRVALYTFILVFILLFILMLFFWPLFSAIFKMMPRNEAMDGQFNPFTSFSIPVALIIIPLLSAVFVTLVNVILAVCYTLLSIKTGGIKIHLRHVDKDSNMKSKPL